jgi:hypothetical protein
MESEGQLQPLFLGANYWPLQICMVLQFNCGEMVEISLQEREKSNLFYGATSRLP